MTSLTKDGQKAAIKLLDRIINENENISPDQRKNIEHIRSVLGTDLFNALLDINNYTEYEALAEKNKQEASKANPYHILDITLTREHNIGLGFSIAGGTDSAPDPDSITPEGCIYITKIIEGGAAEKNGNLQVNDIIAEVNNQNVENVPHEVAVGLLQDAQKQANKEVKLLIKRIKSSPDISTKSLTRVLPKQIENLNFEEQSSEESIHEPDKNNRSTTSDGAKTERTNATTPSEGVRENNNQRAVLAINTIKLTKGRTGLGISIAGGVGNEHFAGDTSIYITNVIEDGAAWVDGRLNVNDKVLSVNNIELENVTHEQAVDILKSTPQQVTLVVDQSLSMLEETKPSPTVREVILTRRHGEGLGFNIVGGDDGEAGIFISHVVPGGVADINGELRVADRILQVNNTDLRNSTHEEAAWVLKNAGDNVPLIVEAAPEEFKKFEERLKEFRQQLIKEKQQEKLAQEYNSNSLPRFTAKNDDIKGCFKALFDFNPEIDSQIPAKGLRINFGDIFTTVNTSDSDWWRVKRVNGPQEEGLIPSMQRLESKAFDKYKRVDFIRQTRDNSKGDLIINFLKIADASVSLLPDSRATDSQILTYKQIEIRELSLSGELRVDMQTAEQAEMYQFKYVTARITEFQEYSDLFEKVLQAIHNHAVVMTV